MEAFLEAEGGNVGKALLAILNPPVLRNDAFLVVENEYLAQLHKSLV